LSPFASVHLVSRGAAVSAVGVVILLAARFLTHRARPAFFSLVYGAILFKCFLLFHPRFFFFDLPIHETLLELVYHRGVLDFWSRLPDYQMQHNLGLSRVGDVYHPYPYPVLFYLIAHLGNVLAHAPQFWLKLTMGVVSALPLFPVGFLARRLTKAPSADVAGGLAYLMAPAYTQALLILGASSLTGHFFDLVVVAFLAWTCLELGGWRRLIAATALIAVSLVAYTSGFISLGLLVASCLILSPFLKGLDRRSALRLAMAGLVGAMLAVATYHPRTISNLFFGVLPAGVEAPADARPPLEELALSARARAHQFLGWPLVVAGLSGLGLIIRRQRSRALRLLVSAWALSGAIAYALRYVFRELLLHEKEMYWIAALLAVTTGVLWARLARRGRWGIGLAVVILLALAAVAITGFWGKAPLYYRFYRFL
jgi:hypothetical protein